MAPIEGNDLHRWQAFTNAPFYLKANTVLGWELRDVWTIESQHDRLQTVLRVPRNRYWRAEKSSNCVEELRFVRFPDRFGTDSSDIRTRVKR